jgi:hypothetical protein
MWRRDPAGRADAPDYRRRRRRRIDVTGVERVEPPFSEEEKTET